MATLDDFRLHLLRSHPQLTDDAMDQYVRGLDPNDPKRKHIAEARENLNSPHPEHREIAATNLRVLILEERWSTCANCGDTYMVGSDGSDTVCSELCATDYTNYLMGI